MCLLLYVPSDEKSADYVMSVRLPDFGLDSLFVFFGDDPCDSVIPANHKRSLDLLDSGNQQMVVSALLVFEH